jgi:hypothetical protein
LSRETPSANHWRRLLRALLHSDGEHGIRNAGLEQREYKSLNSLVEGEGLEPSTLALWVGSPG